MPTGRQQRKRKIVPLREARAERDWVGSLRPPQTKAPVPFADSERDASCSVSTLKSAAESAGATPHFPEVS